MNCVIHLKWVLFLSEFLDIFFFKIEHFKWIALYFEQSNYFEQVALNLQNVLKWFEQFEQTQLF